jgi:hypothetical protein
MKKGRYRAFLCVALGRWGVTGCASELLMPEAPNYALKLCKGRKGADARVSVSRFQQM